MENCSAPSTRQRPSLAEVAASFLKLGTIAFGGPAAHIAMMEEEFVGRRGWLTREEFLDRLASANLIPGPSSTELAIFIGYGQRGWPGLIVAGCCFIIPAAILVTLFAAAYVRYGSLPRMAGMLYAIKPVVIAVILQALAKLARTAVPTKFLAAVAVVAFGLNFFGVNPLLALAISGVLAALGSARTQGRVIAGVNLAMPKALLAVGVAVVVIPVTLSRLFLSFLKIGSIVFGSGYVLLAFLRTEFVTKLHWLTEKQLIDAVAVGQFTPGPVFTTATFIGYIVAGIPGAIVSTIGIFLPGFLLVAVSGPIIPKLRQSPIFSAALDGVVAGSLALMAVVCWQLSRAAVVDWFTLAAFAVALLALIRFRINSAWLIMAAGLLGFFVKG
ncbi:MAG: chromate efflux transporter [Terriglobales bacterium]